MSTPRMFTTYLPTMREVNNLLNNALKVGVPLLLAASAVSAQNQTEPTGYQLPSVDNNITPGFEAIFKAVLIGGGSVTAVGLVICCGYAVADRISNLIKNCRGNNQLAEEEIEAMLLKP